MRTNMALVRTRREPARLFRQRAAARGTTPRWASRPVMLRNVPDTTNAHEHTTDGQN